MSPMSRSRQNAILQWHTLGYDVNLEGFVFMREARGLEEDAEYSFLSPDKNNILYE